MSQLILIQNSGVLTATPADPTLVADGILAAYDENGAVMSLASAATKPFQLVEGHSVAGIKAPVHTILIDPATMIAKKKAYVAPVANKFTFSSVPVGPTGGSIFQIKVIDITDGYEPFPRFSVQLEVADNESAESIIGRFAAGFNAKPDIKGSARSNKIHLVTLSGTSGSATISIGSDSYTATFAADLTTTAANFVTANAGAFLTRYGITLTSAAAVITLTAAKGNFTTPVGATVSGNLAATPSVSQAATQLIFTANEGRIFRYAMDFEGATAPSVATTDYARGSGSESQVADIEFKNFGQWGDYYREVAHPLTPASRVKAGGHYLLYSIRFPGDYFAGINPGMKYNEVIVALEAGVTGNLDTFLGL